MIKKEFRIENQLGSISDAVLVNSLVSIQIQIPQTPKNVITSITFYRKAFFQVCFQSRNNTQLMINKGTTVKSVFMMLKVVNDDPSKVLSTLSLAKSTKDDAACSKDIQKKIVKKAKIITAIIRSLTTFVYRISLEITRNKNKISATKIIKIGPSKLPTLKSNRLIPPIFDNGSLIA